MRLALIAMSSLLVFACKDDEPTQAQTDAPDTSAETTPDSAEPDDSDTTDDSDADDTPDETDTPDVDETDTADTSPGDSDDTADVPETSCEYFEERQLLRCGPNDAITQVLYWVSVDAAACPPYYTRGEDRYATIEALATGEQCDASCVFKARNSVDFIRCDGLGRNGFDTYEADDEACGTTLYYTSDGIFPDLCLWALYACHCEEE